jgi:uncharacterized membrane protein YeiB
LIIRRALFLLILGLVFSLYWQADILHFYAFYLLIAAFLISASKRLLLLLITITAFLPVILHGFFSWESGWDWNNLRYQGFHTPEGFFRNLLFNGFHPLFPWIAFLFLGMMVGRFNLHHTHVHIRLLIVASFLFISAEIASYLLTRTNEGTEQFFLFHSAAMHPMPLFVISSSGMALMIFSGISLLSGRLPQEFYPVKALSQAGRTVMTHYISHLIIGLPLLLLIGHFFPLTQGWIALYAMLYFSLSLFILNLWIKKYSRGPLEGLMRKMAG